MAQIITIDMMKVQQEGFSPQQMKRLKTTCIATSEAIEMERYSVPVNMVADFIGVDENKLTGLARKNLFPPKVGVKGQRQYDIRAVLRALWGLCTKTDNDHAEELTKSRNEKIQMEIAREKKLLIPRQDAEDRMVGLLSAVRNIIQFAIRKSAAMVVGIPTAQDAEDIFRKQFKDATDLLEREAKNDEWVREL